MMFPKVGGQLGQLIRDYDWSATSIGPLEAWPQSLKSVTQTLLLSPVPIVLLWGEDGVMIYNDAYSAFAGQRHPRLLGSKVREGWDEIADFNDNVMRVGLAGGTLAFRDQELALERRGKLEPVWMDLDYSPVLDEAGIPAGVIAIVAETTERVLAQRRLLESERRFRALTTASSDVIYRLSSDWTEMRQLDGRSILADMEAPSIAWMEDYILADDREAMRSAIDEAMAGVKPFQREHRVRRADGSVGWVSSRAVPVTDEHGAILEWFGAASDITERVRTTEHLKLLVNELNHRVKNTLAMVQAIAIRTFRPGENVGPAQQEFAARLVALAQANDLLTGERWAGASLSAAIVQAVHPHQHDPRRYAIRGSDLRISPKTALAVAMAMHELATNAVKHGAWSKDEGIVVIEWFINSESLHIEWRETGGPKVTPPTRRSFGTRLIEKGLAGELGGKVSLYFDPEGVRCVIDAPLSVVVEEYPVPLRILVVEDEMTVAFMIEDMLVELGHDVIELAMRLPEALEAARRADIDLAILDVNLDGHRSFPVADILIERDIPFAFATGYGAAGLDAAYRNRPVLAKPFLSDDLKKLLLKTISA